jgi:hypothetical protein
MISMESLKTAAYVHVDGDMTRVVTHPSRISLALYHARHESAVHVAFRPITSGVSTGL